MLRPLWFYKSPVRGFYVLAALGAAALLLLTLSPALSPAPSPIWAEPVQHLAAVASAHPAATEAGIEILRAGGNAFDAAVAAAAALAVAEPYSSGLGGGGFWLLHRTKDGPKDGMDVMLDARERAPLAARPDMYLDASGRPIAGASIDGPLAAAIPGTPAALAYLAEHYGRLPLRATLAPAIKMARAGVAVTARYRRRVAMRRDILRRSAAAARVFLADGQVPGQDAVIAQPDLAVTLEKLAQQGAAGFYQGPVAQALVSGVREAGGIWTLQDLTQYRVIERAPVRGEYRGIRITSASPPSAGGIALIEALNILSGYRLDAVDSVMRKHLVVEALRRAYRDRAQYLGDPDFVQVPVAMLLHSYYAAGLRGSIRLDRATRSDELAPVTGPLTVPPVAVPPVGRNAEAAHDTTHFCVLDREGNRVAATLTINYPFGSGFMAPGTGVLLNDEMDDFSSGPGLPNVYGLTGGQANAIAPGKRPLSSMTPTILEDWGRQDGGRQDWGGEGYVRKDGGRISAVGTPGGSRIISMVLLAVLDFANGKDAASWVAQGRFHHQYLPDEVEYEPGVLSEQDIAGLLRLGHHVRGLPGRYGNMQAWLWDLRSGKVQAASDPRGEGLAEVLSASQRAHSGDPARGGSSGQQRRDEPK